MKRRTNNHRSKHKDNRLQDSYRARRDKTLTEKKTDKYGVSTLLDEESLIKVEEEE